MDKIVLKSVKSSVQYQGQFVELAFDTLASPVRLYKNLLKNLGKYGASAKDLKFEAVEISEANLTCLLVDLNGGIRIGLDRLEVTFYDLGLVGQDTANQIILDSHEALSDMENPIKFKTHVVKIETHAQLANVSYDNLVSNYINFPPSLGDKVSGGLALYLGDDPEKGERGATVMVDRSVVVDGGVYIYAAVEFDASLIPIESVRQKFSEFHGRCLDHLSLMMERD